MDEMMNKVGKRLPYSEAPQYVDSLLEKCRLNAIAEAPRRKSRNVRRLWLTAASAAAVVAIVATVTLKLTLGGDSDTGKVLCSVTSVEQSAPLSDVLASMSDDQLADVSYYSTDDIPEY